MTMSNGEDLTVSRLINAPPSAVWTAWKDPAHLVKWWAPAPFVTVSTKHEFYAGGGFGTIMRMEDGTEFYNAEGCFLEVVENERLIWTSALRGGWRPNKDEMPFSAVITLEEHQGGTKYTAIALHHNAEDRQKHADMGFVDGWGKCIEQLGKVAEELT